MATSLTSLNGTIADREDPELAVRHMTQTLQLVNQRLSRVDAVSDVSIAVVVMIAHYERHQERYSKGLVHLDGLRRMVEMRGGISQLTRDNSSLGRKITR